MLQDYAYSQQNTARPTGLLQWLLNRSGVKGALFCGVFNIVSGILTFVIGIVIQATKLMEWTGEWTGGDIQNFVVRINTCPIWVGVWLVTTGVLFLYTSKYPTKFRWTIFFSVASFPLLLLTIVFYGFTSYCEIVSMASKVSSIAPMIIVIVVVNLFAVLQLIHVWMSVRFIFYFRSTIDSNTGADTLSASQPNMTAITYAPPQQASSTQTQPPQMFSMQIHPNVYTPGTTYVPAPVFTPAPMHHNQPPPHGPLLPQSYGLPSQQPQSHLPQPSPAHQQPVVAPPTYDQLFNEPPLNDAKKM